MRLLARERIFCVFMASFVFSSEAFIAFDVDNMHKPLVHCNTFLNLKKNIKVVFSLLLH